MGRPMNRRAFRTPRADVHLFCDLCGDGLRRPTLHIHAVWASISESVHVQDADSSVSLGSRGGSGAILRALVACVAWSLTGRVESDAVAIAGEIADLQPRGKAGDFKFCTTQGQGAGSVSAS